jgi:tight adherence protein B
LSPLTQITSQLPTLISRLNPAHLPWTALKWASLAAFALTYLIGFWAIASDATSIAVRYWTRYRAWLDRSLRSMFLEPSGKRIAVGQLLALVVVVALGLVTMQPAVYLLLPLIAFAPRAWVARKKAERVARLELQLSGFLQILSSSLRSTPSIGAALQAIVGVLESPIREEVKLALSELSLGSPLDQALVQMGSRIGSRSFDTAISAILVGRTSGGDLPKMLEENAKSLREAHRLDGVLKSKTADARNQLMVMSAMPPVLVIGFSILSPGFFDPLLTDFTGYGIIAGSSLLWVTALVWARQIMGVAQ